MKEPKQIPSVLVDLEWGAARINFEQGAMDEDGDLRRWYTKEEGEQLYVRMASIDFFAPAQEGMAAQSLSISRTGIVALKEALSNIHYGEEWPYQKKLQEIKDAAQAPKSVPSAPTTDNDIPF